MAAEDRAVVVGINRYPALGDLEGPENDARAFHEWLTSPKGGDVPEANVSVILSSQFPTGDDAKTAEPTVMALDHAFDTLVELAETKEGKAGRRLYLFMAGHGFAPDLKTAALLMANAAKGRTGHHIPGPAYADWFRQSASFDEVVLFMDCCRERYPRAPLRQPPYDLLSGTKPAAYFYGLATEWSRAARERPSGDQVRGLFTEALVAGLWGKARNEEGAVTGASLEEFVYNTVKTGGAPGEELQEPEFSPTAKRSASIVFATGVPKLCFKVRATVKEGGGDQTVELFYGGDLKVPLPGQRAGDAWEWEVDRTGLYKVQASGGGQQLIEVLNEETVDVQL